VPNVTGHHIIFDVFCTKLFFDNKNACCNRRIFLLCIVLLLLNWSWSWSYSFGLGLGLGLNTLVLFPSLSGGYCCGNMTLCFKHRGIRGRLGNRNIMGNSNPLHQFPRVAIPQQVGAGRRQKSVVSVVSCRAQTLLQRLVANLFRICWRHAELSWHGKATGKHLTFLIHRGP